MCISLVRCFIVPQGLHIRLGIEIMVWDGRHHLCAVHVVNDMQYVVFDCCNVCLCWCFIFLNMLFWGHTASCGTSSIFMSQMAVGFSDAMFLFGVFIINAKESSFSSFCSVSGNVFWVWFTWLKGGNHFALLQQCNHCLEMFLFF